MSETGSVLEYLKVKYNELFYDNADPRIRDKLFMGSPIEIVLAYLCYVFLITYILPKFMENRKPFDFKKLYGYVDKILFLVESYFLCWGLFGWIFVYNWICQPFDNSESVYGLLAAKLCWQFLMSKFVYMLQSVPHILSKRKTPAATFMLLHHTIFPLMIWVEVNYYPGGHVSKT
jgi:hypothetical protein